MKWAVSALFAVALALGACATNPATVEITPQSQTGLIVLVAEPTQAEYALDMLRFNEEGTALEADTFHAIHPFMVDPSSSPRLLMREAKPGRYVFVSVDVQGHWDVCFHEKTFAFDLGPGEVVYLGRFNPNPHIAQLFDLAERSGRLTARSGEAVHFFDGIVPPQLTPPSDADAAQIQDLLRTNAPHVSSPVRVASLSQSTFGIGRDVYGTQRLCGGYYERR